VDAPRRRGVPRHGVRLQSEQRQISDVTRSMDVRASPAGGLT
jgi:hypothetical protein